MSPGDLLPINTCTTGRMFPEDAATAPLLPAKNEWWQRRYLFQHTEMATRKIHSVLKLSYSLLLTIHKSTPKGSQPHDMV